MQTVYNNEIAVAQIGQFVDTRNRNVESYAAAEIIPFGRMVAKSNDPAKPNSVRLPRRTIGSITLSADLVASNKFNGTVNGVAMAEVTYATSHDATMDAIIEALEDVSTVKRAALGDEDGDNRTILVEVTDTNVALTSFAVTAGGSQATVTTAMSGASEQLVGVSIFSHTKENTGAGDSAYAEGDAVGVLTQGSIWVPTVDVPDLNPMVSSSAFNPRLANVVIGGDDAGKFTGSPPPGGITTRAVANTVFNQIIDNGDDTGAAALVINLPSYPI